MDGFSDGNVQMPVRHEINLLTKCSVAPNGDRLMLGFRNTRGADTTLTIEVEQAGALLMTLPGLIARALRLQHGDPDVRYVFPLGDWTLESEGGTAQMILNLTTPDGYAVSFVVTKAQAGFLATALGEGSNADQSAHKRH